MSLHFYSADERFQVVSRVNPAIEGAKCRDRGLGKQDVLRSPSHEPIRWRHVSWSRRSPDRDVKEQSRWGWLFYRRVKTDKTFYRPMNRVVHTHIKSIMPENPVPDDPVLLGGSARPNARFQELCQLAGIRPRTIIETGKEESWLLK